MLCPALPVINSIINLFRGLNFPCVLTAHSPHMHSVVFRTRVFQQITDVGKHILRAAPVTGCEQ